MRLRAALASLLALLLFAAVVVPPVAAEPVKLRTGETVKGRPIQERSNEAYLTVEDFLTGAFRHFAWAAVDPDDRDRIQEMWGWKNTGQNTTEGDRLEQRVGDSTDTLLGLIERETDTHVYLRRNGDVIPIPKSQIVSRDKEEMDVRQIWSPEQLVQRQKEAMERDGVNLDDMEARDHWRLATYAEWAGDLDVARDSYAAAAADEEYLKRDLAAQRLQRVEELLQDRAALATLKDARLKLGMRVFRSVREILDGFAEAHPDASEEVMSRLEQLRAEFNERRTREFQQIAKFKFVDIVEDLIRQKVREKDLTITDVTSWTRRELPDEAFAKLASDRYMGRYDDVTPEEARTFWEGRDKSQWRRVTYGAGTFIVDPPKVKPPSNRRRGGSSRGGGGPSPQVQIPKPPTRDQWWEEVAQTREKEQWVLAYFVERSELFELGDREYRPCSLCHGAGLLSKVLQTGDTLSYLCTRCGGAQQDAIVKFR